MKLPTLNLLKKRVIKNTVEYDQNLSASYML
jgi:hypothetical protein